MNLIWREQASIIGGDLVAVIDLDAPHGGVAIAHFPAHPSGMDAARERAQAFIRASRPVASVPQLDATAETLREVSAAAEPFQRILSAWDDFPAPGFATKGHSLAYRVLHEGEGAWRCLTRRDFERFLEAAQNASDLAGALNAQARDITPLSTPTAAEALNAWIECNQAGGKSYEIGARYDLALSMTKAVLARPDVAIFPAAQLEALRAWIAHDNHPESDSIGSMLQFTQALRLTKRAVSAVAPDDGASEGVAAQGEEGGREGDAS